MSNSTGIVYLAACRQCSDEPYRFASAEDRRDWVMKHLAATGHRLTEPLRMETADGRWYGGHIAIEPPAEVTRVRTLDGTTGSDKNSTMIRGAECEFCGPGHSHWAYVPAGASGKPPAADSTRQDEGGWHCWLDLDSTGALTDDTENDNRMAAGIIGVVLQAMTRPALGYEEIANEGGIRWHQRTDRQE